LASLWRLLVPGDRAKSSLSPLAFHSISSGLFSLLSSFHITAVPQHQSPFGPTPPPGLHQVSHPDIQSAQDLISQFLSGSIGDLDEGSLEEEYATELSARDKRQAGLLRQAVFLIGLANSFEFSLATLPWMLNNLVEVRFPCSVSEVTDNSSRSTGHYYLPNHLRPPMRPYAHEKSVRSAVWPSLSSNHFYQRTRPHLRNQCQEVLLLEVLISHLDRRQAISAQFSVLSSFSRRV